MKAKSVIIFVIFLNALAGYVVAQDATDPFDSLLPSKNDPNKSGAQTKAAEPPAVSIEGAVWDTDMPQAIIDGDVYKVGDTLKNVDAKIYKIEKNKVFIFYEGRLFEMKVTGKKEAK